MQGTLKDMSVINLIQHNCMEQKTARLMLNRDNQIAMVFFQGGNMVHAICGNEQGEEVVYHIISWEDGTFNLETGIEPPDVTITRSWSGLLLEGARRLDENELETDLFELDQTIQPEEVNEMAKLDDILKEMGGEVTGYIASSIVGMDGICIAQHAKVKMDAEVTAAQMTLLLKLVDSSVTKLGAGVVEDNLTTTDNTYTLMRYLPDKQYYLGLAIDRKTGSLGNARMISKMYGDRIAKAMPR